MQDCPRPGATAAAWASFFSQPAVYPHICKLFYKDEWRRSLHESHPSGPALSAALAAFERDVSTIAKRWPDVPFAAGPTLTVDLSSAPPLVPVL